MQNLTPKFYLFAISLFLVAFFANGSLINFGLVNPLSSAKHESAKNSLANDPDLIGPDRLCMVFGSIIAEFYGAGDPLTDVYSWKIFGPSNELLFNKSGGGGLQTLPFTYSKIGIHRIELIVQRGLTTFPTLSKEFEVRNAPEFFLENSYSLCGSDPITLIAIDPNDPNISTFNFIWKNSNGDVIGNNNSIEISSLGDYSASIFITNSEGNNDCEFVQKTTVIDSSNFEITSPEEDVCPNQSLEFSTNPTTIGKWYVQKIGSPDEKFISTGSSISINPNTDLDEPGKYEIIFKVDNLEFPDCTIEKVKSFDFNPLPDFILLDPLGASGCLSSDGTIRIQAITPIDYIYIEGKPIQTPSLVPGEIYEIPSLKSGAYHLVAVLGSCTNSYASVVPLIDPPTQLEFEIIDIKDEVCSEFGKENGSFTIRLLNGPTEGYYRILNEKGSTFSSEEFSTDLIPVSIPGGRYVLEIFDKDDCNLPQQEFIEINGLDQVTFSIDEELFICQTKDFIPTTIQNLEFTLTYPDKSKEIKKSGEPFVLTQGGEYEILGVMPGQSEICPLLKTFEVSLVDPVDFEPTLVNEDCLGNRVYEAKLFGRDPSEVVFTWINEKNEIVGTGQFLFPVSIGEFKLDVQPANSSACPIPPKTFLIKEPVLEVDVTLESTQLCELGPDAIITLETTFFEEVTDINWRRFNENGSIDDLPEFKNKTTITVAESGTYEASVFSNIPAINKIDCELGRSTIDLAINPNKIDFTIPASLSICESYEFIPETTQDLTFEITYPNGETTTKQSGEPLNLNQKGTYLFLGISNDQVPTLCPEVKSMEVTVNSKIPFTPELIQDTCDGTKIYQANLGSISPAIADITWFDESGNIIGTTEFLTLNSYGNFALDVQPKGSLPCDQIPVPFFVETPVLEVPVSISSDPLCPDAEFTVITATSQFDLVNRIEWWFTDLNGIEKQLASETDRKEILGLEEGTYEVRIFNSLYCLLGFDKILIMRSMDTVRPEVNENYLVCPRYEIAETINPGTFASYEWYHEGNLVSTNSTYKPSLIGNFELIVFSEEGCAYQTSFITEEECELKVSFPNAIQPGNPDKQFLIYTNYLIDELEIWVFSKWGEVIFHCAKTELLSEESTCIWDGYLEDQKLPPGSYAYRVNFRNNEKNISKYQLGSILIID